MNFGERLREINREAISKTPVYQADGETCVFCGTRGALVRESDFHYHDRTRIDVSIGYMHVVHGSLYCDFCQKEQPGTHVAKKNLVEKPKGK